MFRLIRKFFIYCTGWMWKKADVLDEDPTVAAATFDMSIEKASARANEIHRAVGALVGIKEEKVEDIKNFEAQCEELEDALEGAQLKANKRGLELKAQGKTKEEINQDPEIIRCRTGYEEAEADLAQRRERVKQLEAEMQESNDTVAHYQAELQRITNGLRKLREEKQEHIADLESSKALDEANRALAGISNDTTDKDLEAVRRKRREVRGRAKASRQLAGTDAQRATEDFVAYARKEKAASKFDALMDWSEDEKPAEEREASKLPE